MPVTSKTRSGRGDGYRLTAGDVATGVAYIARVEGARTADEAREKFASIVGAAGAMPLWTRDSSVQVRVYFNPGLARDVAAHESVATVTPDRLKIKSHVQQLVALVEDLEAGRVQIGDFGDDLLARCRRAFGVGPEIAIDDAPSEGSHRLAP